MTKNEISLTNYAFIDANNLYLGARKEGIKVDYRKLRLYLKNRFQISKAFLFIGYDPARKRMYQYFRQCGFELIFKQTTPIMVNGKKTLKGNVDAELVLHAAAVEYNNYNRALIITGDGDFACLIKYLIKNKKFCRLITPHRKFSCLLRRFNRNITSLASIAKSVS